MIRLSPRTRSILRYFQENPAEADKYFTYKSLGEYLPFPIAYPTLRKAVDQLESAKLIRVVHGSYPVEFYFTLPDIGLPIPTSNSASGSNNTNSNTNSTDSFGRAPVAAGNVGGKLSAEDALRLIQYKVTNLSTEALERINAASAEELGIPAYESYMKVYLEPEGTKEQRIAALEGILAITVKLLTEARNS